LETAPLIGSDQGQVALLAAVVLGCLLVVRGLFGLLKMWGRSGRGTALSLFMASLRPKARRTRVYRASASDPAPPGFSIRAGPGSPGGLEARKREDRAVATLPKAGAASSALSAAETGLLRRFRGDLRACASLNGVAALLEEPRYRDAIDLEMLDAVLERSLAFAPEMHAVRAVLRGAGLVVSDPHPYEKRVVRLLPSAEDGRERWNHRSAYLLCAALGRSRRKTGLLRARGARDAGARHGIDLLVYFDTECRLIGWERPAETT
jgi:hypothetical protein